MHDRKRVKSRSQVVHHNAGALGQPLQSPNRKRLPNIEDTEEYKAREKGFPTERDGDDCNQLPRYFINDDELRILQTGGASDPGGGGNSDEGHNCGGDNRRPCTARDRDPRTCQRPHNDRGQRSLCAGAGLEASRAEESCDQRGPQCRVGARRPHNSRRDAGATVGGRGGGWVAARHVAPSSSAAGVRASRPHTGSDGSPVAVLVAAFTTGPLYRWLGPRLCLRHRHPATKSRTRRWPKRFMK